MFGIGGGNSIWLLVILSIGVVGFIIYKKRQDSKTNNSFLSSRKNKDEVWRTIKQYLKDNNEAGKEIVDSYVVKRRDIDMFDPYGSIYDRKNKVIESRIRKWYYKQNKITKQTRELFVVVFTTRNVKTLEIDKPRAIEVEVINKKINKNEFDRKILINSLLDYDQEMEWIFPIRIAEKSNQLKQEEQQKKYEMQKQKKLQKMRLKEQAKKKKNAKKV